MLEPGINLYPAGNLAFCPREFACIGFTHRPLPARNGHIHLVLRRGQAHVPVPIVCYGPDVRLFEFAGLEGIYDGLGNLILGKRHLHRIQLCGSEEPVNVFWQPEYGRTLRRVITPDPLKYQRRIVQRMRQDMDLGVFEWHHLAVHPYHADFFHGIISILY